MNSSTPPRALSGERDRWERLARDPYYAVLNVDVYRDGQMSLVDRATFTRSGEDDVARTIDDIRRWIEPGFAPRRAVDFGCGVGRLTIPLARLADTVVGIDISPTMLAEARRNCEASGITNARFVSSAEYFGADGVAAPVDFVHAYIVFQHMPRPAGMWVADALLTSLEPGGVAALHFTYGRRASWVRRVVHRLRRHAPGVNALVNAIQGRALSEPLIPMNEYDLGALFALFVDHGCTAVHARLTDHGGHLGAMLLLRKP